MSISGIMNLEKKIDQVLILWNEEDDDSVMYFGNSHMQTQTQTYLDKNTWSIWNLA